MFRSQVLTLLIGFGLDMSSPTTPAPAAGRAVEDRASNEFARVVNLSDAVFAIAMTLLVLTVDVPDVASRDLAAALIADLPQLGAYALAFVLVASQWYAHRKLFQRLAFTEVGLTLINLAFLGLVALVPFPTSVLGSYPLATAAVIAFLATFGLLGVTYLALIVRAQAMHAWQQPLPDSAYRRIRLAVGANTSLLVAGIGVAVWQPAVALGLALVSSAPTILLLRRVPLPYRHWF
jgi:uncharacterized membrane protein